VQHRAENDKRKALAILKFPGAARVVDLEAADIISATLDPPPTFTML
jgi:hypothetical protein